MTENNKKYLVELHGTRDTSKLSYLWVNGFKILGEISQEITPNTNIRHNFSVNGRNIIENMKDDTSVHVVFEIELVQGTNNFVYSNTDNYGWAIVLSLQNEEIFKMNRGTNFNVKVRVGQRTIRPKMQGLKRIKSKTRMKLSGIQFDGGLLRRIQNIGKNNQVEVETIPRFGNEVLPQENDENVPFEFTDEATEKRQRKKLSLFG